LERAIAELKTGLSEAQTEIDSEKAQETKHDEK
jgi:hypothetical protein